MWRKFVNDILHRSIITDVVQGMTLMDHNVASRTSVFVTKVLHETAFTNCRYTSTFKTTNNNKVLIHTCMKTLGDGGRIDEISFADLTGNMRIQAFQFNFPLHLEIGNHWTVVYYSLITATAQYIDGRGRNVSMKTVDVVSNQQDRQQQDGEGGA